MLSLTVLFALPAFAEFHSVKSKFCNQDAVPVLAEERIFIDLTQGILGFGFTDQNCKIVDFKSVVVSSLNSEQTVLTPVSSIGRRTTCTTGIAPYAGVEFNNAIILPHSLELTGVTGGCSGIVFNY